MRIFIAGGTGVLGRRLIPLLVEEGHEVFGTSRSAEGGERIRQGGATPIVMDAFDEGSVKEAVTAASPDVVVHELTAIPPNVNLRRFGASFAETNRLRIEGTDHLLRAARSAGARRFVAQSYAAWPYERRGGPVKTETDPSTTLLPRGCGARSTRSATWSRRRWQTTSSTGLCCGTGPSTAPARRSRRVRRRGGRAAAPVPDRRLERGGVVLRAPRRRRPGDGPGDRSGSARDLQRHR